MTRNDRVPEALARALAARGYLTLTPVQQAVLAAEPPDGDMLVSAQTGSGKTVAFGLAIARHLIDGQGRLLREGRPKVLVITPTRELAQQVQGELSWLYSDVGARILCCTGGADMRAERRALEQGADAIVGSPGRLRDHLERGSIDLSDLAGLVLDEADDILDLGFRDDLEFILDAAPNARQTLLFSATFAHSIEILAQKYQRGAQRIEAGCSGRVHADIRYEAVLVAPNDRENAIVNLLRFHEPRGAIVFCGRRDAVAHLASRLGGCGFKVVPLSGALSQKERNASLLAMRDGKARICVATDVAARGIDLPDLELVIHADLPVNTATLLHRSGRTGRAGRKGISVLVIPHNERRRADRLLCQARVPCEWTSAPGVEAILARDHARLRVEVGRVATISDEERAFVEDLLAEYNPEQLAVSLIRCAAKGRPSPEELIGAPDDFKRLVRPRFRDGVWFQIDVGSSKNAEIRWLMPLICRIGHITKREIGKVRILGRVTLFEVDPTAAERFAATVSQSNEKNVRISAAAPAPTFTAGCPQPVGSSVPVAVKRGRRRSA